MIEILFLLVCLYFKSLKSTAYPRCMQLTLHRRFFSITPKSDILIYTSQILFSPLSVEIRRVQVEYVTRKSNRDGTELFLVMPGRLLRTSLNISLNIFQVHSVSTSFTSPNWPWVPLRNFRTTVRLYVLSENTSSSHSSTFLSKDTRSYRVSTLLTNLFVVQETVTPIRLDQTHSGTAP